MSHKGAQLFASAAERNKQPILDVLKQHLKENMEVLEIASGTGQHVIHFAKNLSSSINFQPTDIDKSHLDSISAYVKNSALKNVSFAEFLDVRSPVQNWLNGKLKPESIDCILNINMVHISDYKCAIGLFEGCKYYLKPNGLLIMYGPFAMNGVIQPESNVNFDRSLKSQNPEWGLRDVYTQLAVTAQSNNMSLTNTYCMPANNHILVWKKFA